MISLLFSQQSVGAENWITIAETKESKWAVKKGTFEFSTNKMGEPVWVVIGRTKNRKSLKVDLYKWYVTEFDCGRELGKVVSLDISGVFLFDNDFVFGGETIATSMAETFVVLENIH